MRHRLLFFLALVVVLPLLLCGCGSGSVSGRVDAGKGTLTIHLTDAPIDLANVQSVVVTIEGVLVYPEEEGGLLEDGTDAPPIVLTTHPATFDLLTLTGGATALLASGEVPAGRYGRIRLQVSDARLTYLDGATADLKIESNKVDVPIPFTVTAGATADLTLDFDAAASVQVNENGTGQLILRPVVTPVGSAG